ncbi:MAG: helix-turn-helix domain-containing protein [Eubacteriales bacterium]|nr:helix-turn-helix transcriptional regulator [Clostridiales bacterium]
MKFGEKLRQARLKAKYTQEQLANVVQVTKRTIINYETGKRYPRDRGMYARLAEALGVDVNYLLTEDEEFITEAASKYGSKGEAEARELLERSAALFAGGELSDEDKLAFLLEIQQLYLESKEIAKKFAPKKRSSD